MTLDAARLYRYLKDAPRDGRWMLRRVGPDYPRVLEELARSGLPVEVRMDDVGGQQRAVYRAADQAELFGHDQVEAKPRRRRRKGRTPDPGRLL